MRFPWVRFGGLLAIILIVAGCGTPAPSVKPTGPAATAVRGSGYRDERTGIIFPADVSRWVLNDRHAYEPKSLGISYSYKSKLQRLGAITCYLYDRGISDIPTGGASAIVQREMAEVVQTVVLGAQQRGASTESLLPISDLRTGDGKVLALVAAHRLVDQGVTNVSLSALTGYKGYFLKIRFTFPGNDLDAALTGLGGLAEFIAEMREVNKGNLDPYFPTGGLEGLGSKR